MLKIFQVHALEKIILAGKQISAAPHSKRDIFYLKIGQIATKVLPA